MGKKVSEYTLSAIKWFDFLGGLSQAITGCAICAIVMFSPMMIMSPPIALVLGIGFVVVPVCFKSLSSMLILAFLSDTYSLLWYTAFFYTLFIVGFIIVVRVKLYTFISMLNPSKLGKLKDCLINIASDEANAALQQTINDATANAANQVNNAIKN